MKCFGYAIRQRGTSIPSYPISLDLATLIVLLEVYDDHLKHFRQVIGVLQSEFCIFRIPGPGNQAIWIVDVILGLDST